MTVGPAYVAYIVGGFFRDRLHDRVVEGVRVVFAAKGRDHAGSGYRCVNKWVLGCFRVGAVVGLIEVWDRSRGWVCNSGSGKVLRYYFLIQSPAFWCSPVRASYFLTREGMVPLCSAFSTAFCRGCGLVQYSSISKGLHRTAAAC